MQNKPSMKLVERTVRTRVCAECPRRTPCPGASPDQPRACEAGCSLFLNLPKLRDLAVSVDPMVSSFRARVYRAARRACIHDSGRCSSRRCERLTRLLAELTDNE